ncbi:unnamed protein product [Alopecurus aequalis]
MDPSIYNTREKKVPDRGHISIMADWASLLPELVQGIADRVLSNTDGVNAYVDMRAVCPSWQSAIAKPSPLAAVTHLRLRPRHWVMLDFKSGNYDDDDDTDNNYDDGNDDTHLFLHVLTGQFRRLRLPVLRDHTLVGASDGLLVLRDMDGPPHLAHVLNPLTGDMIHYAAPLRKPFANIWSTAVTSGSHSRLVLRGYAMIVCATPAGNEFTEEEIGKSTTNMGTFQGNVFVVDLQGQVFKLVAPAERCVDGVVLIAQVPLQVDEYSSPEEDEDDIGLASHLVESSGELLLIRHHGRAVKVYKVDIERKLLEEVKSLGGSALFLGRERRISVDAGNLPSVDGDCIYLFDWVGTSEYMCVYNLSDHTMETISSMDHLDRPFSLVQVLLQYCDFP